ncbi:dopamine receptor type D2 isoform X12 [Nasonia vitripennis]|uniref:Uncharacterized protein n=1 Tax=Nasonia vitripennis TaxID=7425 RepID=A0A7M7R0E3_NASVI|nr:dopamine receptor type D2 isoform X12 [Nasonia vitripennis]
MSIFQMLSDNSKLYPCIFKLREVEKVSKEESRAMQHVLQSKNYYNDYFDLKQRPVDPSWREDDFLIGVRDFIQHQIAFDEKKEEKRSKRTGYETEDKDEEAQGQEGEVLIAAFRQPTDAVDRIPEQAPVKEESVPTDRSR